MNKFIACAVACAAANFFAPSVGKAEPLNAKPGTWEMTVTTVTTPNVITPRELAKLPPYRRSIVEKTMSNRGAKPNTSVQKICVQKEDIDRDRFPRTDDSDCTRQTILRTAKKMMVATTCLGSPRTGTVSFEANTPESVVGTIDQPTGNGKFHAAISGKWLGRGCVGAADRLARMR